ncbi:AraC family transcriptional regulator [Nocardioides stalactiti]|uniref:AraC family transcriptional regulator n=1 Tax=Nocardioides stalactiti TaxID=2755356 RepID=UPI0015FFE5EC|nr:AraC family transcriptional regulator [Nocardioides stalactiti]
MRAPEPGVPPLAFAQMLLSAAIGPEARARFREVMAREGTHEAALVASGVPAPVRWFREVFPDLDTDEATRLGLDFAEHAHLTSFGPLSMPLVSAGSVAEIVELLAYLPLISTAVRPQFHTNERGLTVGLTGHTGDPDLDCLVIAYCGATVLRLLDMLAGTLPSIRLHLGWPTPSSWTEEGGPRGTRVIFDAPTSYVQVPRDALDEACRFADPVAYRVAISELRRALERRDGAVSFSERVRVILEDDPSQFHSQRVAHQLCISTSTLKRKLAEEGTTFRDIRESWLRERAIVRLLDSSATISQVAGELGYSDLTNFSHAFKRWTGQSPSEFRQLSARFRDHG